MLTNVNIVQVALSNKKGEAQFNYVPEFPAYSGLKKREYPKENVQTKQVTVKTEKLDDVIPETLRIDFVKIDVEGAEYLVLQGAKNLLIRAKPIIIFEFGLGASEFYGTKPEMMYDFFASVNYNVGLIDQYLANRKPLSKKAFVQQYTNRLNYYFIAFPN